MAPKIEAVFFDLGDTLVKISYVTLAKICRKISDEEKISLSTDEYTRAFHDEWKNRSSLSETKLVKNIKTDAEERERRYWRTFFDSLLFSLNIKPDNSELIEWLIDIYTAPQSFVCFDDVHHVLTELKRKGYTLGIISNAFPSADKILDHLNLRQYFKYIFLSFELPYAKPEFEIYQHVSNKTNIPIENIAFVDDRWSFVKSAQEARMNAWLLERIQEKPAVVHTNSFVQKIKNLPELVKQIEEVPNGEIGFHTRQKASHVSIDINQNFCRVPTKQFPIPFMGGDQLWQEKINSIYEFSSGHREI
jgi:putative hydrolase of the HAD superfamily